MLYRQFAMALSLLLAVSVAGTAQAQDRAAMESWACNYVEGKGYGDLMKVAAKWDKWASKKPSCAPRCSRSCTGFCHLRRGARVGLIGFLSHVGRVGCYR